MELPPGWYPDPLSSNGKSWWNGSSWVSEEELSASTGPEPVEEFHATTSATYVPTPPGRVVPPAKQPVFRPLRVLGAVFVSVLAVVGLFAAGLAVHPDLNDDQRQTPAASPPTAKPDLPPYLSACSELTWMIDDVAADIVAHSELRERVKAVDDKASGPLRNATSRMLAALTTVQNGTFDEQLIAEYEPALYDAIRICNDFWEQYDR